VLRSGGQFFVISTWVKVICLRGVERSKKLFGHFPFASLAHKTSNKIIMPKGNDGRSSAAVAFFSKKQFS
jgi:hypothetical protein